MAIEHWREFAAIYFAASVAVYGLLSGSTYWLLWVRGRRALSHLKVQPHWPGPSQVRSEIAWSLVTIAIFTVVATLLYVAWDNGLTPLVYLDIQEYGWGYFFLSILLMVLLHDAWFYWSHRLLHHPRLFRRFHSRHHRSRTPTPWSTHTFHPVEALLQIAILPLIVFLMPAHPLAMVVFNLLLKVYNTIGHMGYELFPRAFGRHWLFRWSNSTTHHDLHHSRVKGHYGLYFNFWDRMMGTNLPEYRAEFERITASRLLEEEALGATES